MRASATGADAAPWRTRRSGSPGWPLGDGAAVRARAGCWSSWPATARPAPRQPPRARRPHSLRTAPAGPAGPHEKPNRRRARQGHTALSGPDGRRRPGPGRTHLGRVLIHRHDLGRDNVVHCIKRRLRRGRLGRLHAGSVRGERRPPPPPHTHTMKKHARFRSSLARAGRDVRQRRHPPPARRRTRDATVSGWPSLMSKCSASKNWTRPITSVCRCGKLVWNWRKACLRGHMCASRSGRTAASVERPRPSGSARAAVRTRTVGWGRPARDGRGTPRTAAAAQ